MSEPWYAQTPVERWPAALSAEPHRFVGVYHAFIRAELDAFADCELVAWDRKLGAMFHSIDPDEQLRNAGEHAIVADTHDSRGLRRWCWAPGWYLWQQDEDLALMNDECLPTLLEEAALECPKHEYIYAIVEHFVRDAAHAALWPQIVRRRRASGEAVLHVVDAALARAERVLALASPDASQLMRYCRRLTTYAQRRPVDADEARQRVFDLRRCSADEHRPVEIVDDGELWVARLDQSGFRKGRLYVRKASGEMWALTDASSKRRGRRQE